MVGSKARTSDDDSEYDPSKAVEKSKRKVQYKDPKKTNRSRSAGTAAEPDEDSDSDELDERFRSRRELRNRFFETEAEVDEQDDYELDEVDDEDAEEEDEEIKRISEEAIGRHARRWNELRERERRNEMQQDVEQAVKDLRSRHKRRPNMVGSQAGRQPTEHDAGLWLVRCKPRLEESSVRRIIAKMPPGYPHVLSIVQRPELRGIFYIESPSRTHVMELLQDIPTVNMRNVTLVDVHSATEVLQLKRASSIPNYTWAKVQQGRYRGDYAIIQRVNTRLHCATVKVVPRIEDEKDGEPKKGKRRLRPKQQLFDPAYFGILNNINSRRNAFEYNKRTFVNGLEELEIGLQNLVVSEPPNKDIKDMFGKTARFTMSPLSPGNRVKVVHGELKKSMGKVVRTSARGTTVTILIHGTEVEVERGDLRRRFTVGDEVRVAMGQHKGARGMVNNLSHGGKQATLFVGHNLPMVDVFVYELDDDQGGTSPLRFLDVVTVRGDVCVVIEPSTNHPNVMNSRGETFFAHATDIVKRQGDVGKSTVHDSSGSTVQPDSEVEVIDGPKRGVIGVVKVIFGTTVFMLCEGENTNRGVVAAESSNIRLHLMPGAKNPGVMESTAMKSARAFKSVGSRVSVSQGRHKGLKGIILEVMGESARIELPAKHQRVLEKLSNLIAEDKVLTGLIKQPVEASSLQSFHSNKDPSAAMYIQSPRMGSETPFMGLAGARTPFRSYSGTPSMAQGSMTPMGASPGYGSATPRHGSMTPRYGNMPGYGSFTPHYGASTPGYGGAMPTYGSATPGIGGSTPGIGSATLFRAGHATPHASSWQLGHGSATPRDSGVVFGQGSETPKIHEGQERAGESKKESHWDDE